MESRHPQNSKMVRHFIFTEKMSPTVLTGCRNFFSDFTDFVRFVSQIKVPKWQIQKGQKSSLLLKFFTSKPL